MPLDKGELINLISDLMINTADHYYPQDIPEERVVSLNNEIMAEVNLRLERRRING